MNALAPLPASRRAVLGAALATMASLPVARPRRHRPGLRGDGAPPEGL
jgi:hypothetical protein